MTWTPLTSIIGYLELFVLRAGTDAGDAEEKYIDIAYVKAKRLEKLIEDQTDPGEGHGCIPMRVQVSVTNYGYA